MRYKKETLTFIATLLLFSVLFETFHANQVKGQTAPTVFITYPNNTTSITREYYARLNDTFIVSITVYSPDIGIWSWQVGIYFNNTILECTSFGNGTFFSLKPTLGFQQGTIHNDLGYVTISGDSLRLPETEGVMGSGVLMWFEFHVKTNTTILYEASLLDLTLSPPDLTCGTKLNEKIDGTVVPVSPIVLYDGRVTIVRMGDLGGGVPPSFFNCDGSVDGKDKALFLLCYKGTAPPEAMYLADLGGGVPPKFFECDGVVDGKDKALFLLCYKGQGPDT